MVADIDWYLRAGQHLKECEEYVSKKLWEYHYAANKQMALMLIPGTLRNEQGLKEANEKRQEAGRAYDEAVKRVVEARNMIDRAPFYPPKKSWWARIYWVYCCIKYRNL